MQDKENGKDRDIWGQSGIPARCPRNPTTALRISHLLIYSKDRKIIR